MSRRVLVSFVLALAGAVIGCLALEAVLQVAAFGLRLTLPSASRTWVQGHRRVLCLGDSSTYGLYMKKPADAYPQQLERIWNARGLQPPIEVLNAGYPGTNSSRLRTNFRPMLEEVRPDVVIVMIGANDYWTVRVPIDEARPWTTVAWDFVRQHSRLYRFIFMALRGVDRRQFDMPDQRAISAQPERPVRYGDVEFSFGWQQAHRQRDHDEQLIANLTAIADEARRFNTHLLFLTYPSKEWNYGDGGRLTRIAAQSAGVPLVDMEKVFEPLCPKEPCPELFFKDHHPTAKGYQLMAETLVERRLEGDESPPAS
jgi:lysophospholipase L1-like esterase